MKWMKSVRAVRARASCCTGPNSMPWQNNLCINFRSWWDVNMDKGRTKQLWMQTWFDKGTHASCVVQHGSTASFQRKCGDVQRSPTGTSAPGPFFGEPWSYLQRRWIAEMVRTIKVSGVTALLLISQDLKISQVCGKITLLLPHTSTVHYEPAYSHHPFLRQCQ